MRVPVVAPYVLAISSLLGSSAIAQDAKDDFFDTRRARHFGNALPALNEYLKNEGLAARECNHFCIIGYIDNSKKRRAYVHWQEGQKLILWGGSTAPEHAAESMTHSRRQLDLKKDVVKTQEDVGSSTYLVTESWVAKVTGDCAAHGAKYEVNCAQTPLPTRE